MNPFTVNNSIDNYSDKSNNVIVFISNRTISADGLISGFFCMQLDTKSQNKSLKLLLVLLFEGEIWTFKVRYYN